jgi:guanylate kinase
MKKTLLFCSGVSGSGKSYFIKNILPSGVFYNLKSATTRQMRDGEIDGREYYFRDENYFETEKFATKLFVNEAFWTPGTPKWLYGVPEFEILNHMDMNFTYDVIQPRYVRQMIDWFRKNNLENKYDFRILWFLPPTNSTDIVQKRQNMPNDIEVRKANTCNLSDFQNAGIYPDHIVISNQQERFIDRGLREFLNTYTR